MLTINYAAIWIKMNDVESRRGKMNDVESRRGKMLPIILGKSKNIMNVKRANPQFSWSELPQPVSFQSWSVDTLGYVYTLGDLIDVL